MNNGGLRQSPNSKILAELFAEHVGKVSDKWTSYLVEYEKILGPYRNQDIRLLEIGVQNGGSLEVWASYFEQAASLIGSDIDPACAQITFDDPRINLVVGDCNDDETEKRLLQCSDVYDVIIDDGSHKTSDIVKAFARYFPALQYGGVYIAEDLHCSYWREFEGGLYFPYSSMAFFKALADIINHEHWGVETPREQILAGILSRSDAPRIPDDVLATIHSVQFFNSLCVIYKELPANNSLGTRVISGSEAVVRPDVLDLHEQASPGLDQSHNEWAVLNRVPEGEPDALGKQLRMQEAEVNRPAVRLEERDTEIEGLRRALEGKEKQLIAVWCSTSWRLTAPVRALSDFARMTVSGVGRVFYRAARSAFWAAPMPKATKRWIRDRIRGHKDDHAWIVPEAITPFITTDGEDPREAYRQQCAEMLERFLANGERLELPRHEKPRVSVILVLFNQAELTFACLQSLARVDRDDLEVIIWDNASSDRTRELLGRVAGATILLNDENLHFLRGCNSAVAHASGEYILFLNNDTHVYPETISAALRIFDEESDVGAVGARVVLLDGRLQEAGSIVWSDGSCVGYGRGDNPNASPYMFRRDVDFCSGVFLMTPRALFNERGKFDQTFAPAYYEESDYCMRLWDAGWRVVYEPSAFLVHHEFASSGQNPASELMKRNQSKFREKHAARLDAAHMEPNRLNVPCARSRSKIRQRVLFIDDQFPHKNKGQGLPRASKIVRLLVEMGYEVTVFGRMPQAEAWEDIYRDIPKRVECLSSSSIEGLREILESRVGYYGTVFVSRPHNMEAYHEVVAERPTLREGVRVIYDAEALFSAREILKRELEGRPIAARRQKAMIAKEVELAGEADAVVTVSEREREEFASRSSVPTHVIGHALEPNPGENGFAERRDFLFVGAMPNDDNPNTDSVLWFVREVWPRVRRHLGSEEARVRIVGLNDSPKVKAMDVEGVEVVGPVDDLRAEYDAARVVVIPTRYAAGVPYKAHEAAAFGVPMVVSTLIGEQLGWRNGGELLAANSSNPKEFADCCVRLYSDDGLWRNVREAAHNLVCNECAPERIKQTVREAVEIYEGSSRCAEQPVRMPLD